MPLHAAPVPATVSPDGKALCLPIYCSVRTLKNVDHIITASPNTDAVPDTWSNETLTGLTENEAIRLTTDWREPSTILDLPTTA